MSIYCIFYACTHTHTHPHPHTHTHTRAPTPTHPHPTPPTHTYTHTHRERERGGYTHMYTCMRPSLCSFLCRMENFQKVLRSYKYVFMYRDCLDGSLRGMFLMGLDRHNAEGERFTVMKVWIGTTVRTFVDHFVCPPSVDWPDLLS